MRLSRHLIKISTVLHFKLECGLEMKKKYLMKFMLSSACCLLATQPMTIASTAEMSALTEPSHGTEQTLSASELSITRIVNDIMMNEGKCGKYTVYNLDAVAGLIQSLDPYHREVTKFQCPAEIISPLALNRLLATEKTELFSTLPNMPSDIKASATPLMMQVFVFAASAFGKDTSPVYVYTTRPVEDNEPVNTSWKDELSTLDGKVAELEKELQILRALPSFGRRLYDGMGVPIDKAGALKAFKIAAKDGCHISQKQCAEMLYNGEGSSVDKVQSFAYYQMAAKQGCCGAQYNCAIMLKNGDGIQQDKNKSFEYFYLAAQQEFNDAALILGDYARSTGTIYPLAKFLFASLLYEGRNITVESGVLCSYSENRPRKINSILDKQDARKFFLGAANAGMQAAQFKYGVMLFEGDAGEIDKIEAFSYFRMAANTGCIDSQFKCGEMLLNGDGVEENKTEAFKYFQMAADQGHHAKAQLNCGILLCNRDDGIDENKTEALAYSKKAADQGLVEAMYQCGVILDHWSETDIKRHEARRYYEMAADRGHLQAQYRYGVMLHNGEGGSRNAQAFKYAFKYIKMAADQGLADAQYNCGILFYVGRGVPENIFEATVYYIRAARQGHHLAQNSMHRFMPETWPAPYEPACAMEAEAME